MQAAFAQGQADFFVRQTDAFECRFDRQVGERERGQAHNHYCPPKAFDTEGQADPSETADKCGDAQRQGDGRLKKGFAEKAVTLEQKGAGNAQNNGNQGNARHHRQGVGEQIPHTRAEQQFIGTVDADLPRTHSDIKEGEDERQSDKQDEDGQP